MRKIMLTRGMSAMVDDEDFEWLNQYKWYAGASDKKFYAVRKGRKIDGILYKIPIYMHRQILKLTRDDELMADHVNGNGLDNRRLNLRKCSYRENNINKILCFDGQSSTFRGVSHIIEHHCWKAEIDNHFIGHYLTEGEAAYYYNEQAKIRHGEFAVLNDLSGLSINLTPRRNRKTPYKGIRFNKRDKMWYARIMQNRKEIYIGCYKDAVSAAIAYNEKAIELHGDKARLNTIRSNALEQYDQ